MIHEQEGLASHGLGSWMSPVFVLRLDECMGTGGVCLSIHQPCSNTAAPQMLAAKPAHELSLVFIPIFLVKHGLDIFAPAPEGSRKCCLLHTWALGHVWKKKNNSISPWKLEKQCLTHLQGGEV